MKRPTDWLRSAERALVLGHRGARHAAPENTFKAFDLALAEGAEGIEFDVRQNGSGEVVVCHDVDLTRVTSGRDTRRVRDLSSAECDRIRLDGDERLPCLREVLGWAERHGALLNIELKTDDGATLPLVRAVLRLLADHPGARELAWISSFSASAVWATAALAPHVNRAWLTEARWGVLPRLSRLGSGPSWSSSALIGIHPRERLITAERMRGWNALDLRVNTWTVNDPARAVALSRLGVNAIISDNPGAVLEALKGASSAAA